MMKIGYLGPKGSFTYSAATRYFKQGTFLSYDSLIDLIDAQLEKEITYAMVPIENTIEGSVLPTLDHVYETLPSISRRNRSADPTTIDGPSDPTRQLAKYHKDL